MSIREIIDWVLNYRITWYAVQQLTIAVGVFFLLVVFKEFLDKVTEDLTDSKKTMVGLALGFFLVLVPFWLGWLD
jgi:hypothetical protein